MLRCLLLSSLFTVIVSHPIIVKDYSNVGAKNSASPDFSELEKYFEDEEFDPEKRLQFIESVQNMTLGMSSTLRGTMDQLRKLGPAGEKMVLAITEEVKKELIPQFEEQAKNEVGESKRVIEDMLKKTKEAKTVDEILLALDDIMKKELEEYKKKLIPSTAAITFATTEADIEI